VEEDRGQKTEVRNKLYLFVSLFSPSSRGKESALHGSAADAVMKIGFVYLIKLACHPVRIFWGQQILTG
jgi:hypothetical protein